MEALGKTVESDIGTPRVVQRGETMRISPRLTTLNVEP